MKDMADFLMISMTINQTFLGKLTEYYSFDDLEDKASRYYGQVALDFNKIGANKGYINTFRCLSNKFDDYMSIMRLFSSKYLNQKVLQPKDLAKLEPGEKKKMFDKYIDKYLDKMNDYNSLVNSSIIDPNLVTLFAKEINNLGAKLSILDPEFKHKEIEY
jgi:hypothetical protein